MGFSLEDASIETLLIIWAVCALVLAITLWRTKNTFGLSIAFLATYTQLYWLGTVLYALPNYNPLYDRELTRIGLLYSLIGLAGFGVGTILLYPSLVRFHRTRIRTAIPQHVAQTPVNEPIFNPSWLPLAYLLVGVLFTFVLGPALLRVPTLNAASSSLGRLLDIGLFLLIWESSKGRGRAYPLIMALATTYPILTTLIFGFLGQGVGTIILLSILIVRNIRFRIWLLVLIPVLIYLILSLAVTYFSERSVIRASVWGGDALDVRAQVLSQSLIEGFQWFDFGNQEHLEAIDRRTGFDFLIGATVIQMRQSGSNFLYGETLLALPLSLIPRALWPDKPVIAGGSERVTELTGIRFAGTTSVNANLIMESYVNFGEVGVFLFFMTLGVIVIALDAKAYEALKQRDYLKFSSSVLLGFALLATGAGIIEVTVSAISAYFAVMLFNQIVLKNLILSK